MNSTEDAVREWMRSATPAPTGRVDVGTVVDRARRRRRARTIAIPSLAAVMVAAAITVVIVVAGPDQNGSPIAASPSTSRIDPGSCSRPPADPDSRVLRKGTAQEMVPPGAVSADVCHYGKDADGVSNGQLLDSDHLDFVTAATLARQINRAGISNPFINQLRGPCFGARLSPTTVTFTYSEGPPVTVAFYLTGCFMTNGVLNHAVNAELNTWIYAYPPAQDVTAGPAVSR